MKNWQCQWLDTSTISIQWALGAGILQRWTYKAIGMWRNGNASVWSLLKYHFSELWWPKFWNHKAIEIRRIANVKTPLKYYSRGLRWTQFWNHKVIGMLRIGNASVWTPLKYHSSGLWWPEFRNFELTRPRKCEESAMPMFWNFILGVYGGQNFEIIRP